MLPGLCLPPFHVEGGGGGGIVARHWKLEFTRPVGVEIAIGELELRATVGGADQTSPGDTASASSELSPSHAANKAIDNNSATTWVSGGQGGIRWWKYHSPVPISVQEILLAVRTDSTPLSFPISGKVLYSDDDVTYTSAWMWGGLETAAAVAGEPHIYTAPASTGVGHVFWRWRSTTMNWFNGIAIIALEFRETTGGAAVIPTAVVDRAQTVRPPRLAFDGNPSTSWFGNTEAEYIIAQFSEAKSFVEFALTVTDQNESPRDFVVEYADSPDGPWTVASAPSSQSGWTGGVPRTFPIS